MTADRKGSPTSTGRVDFGLVAFDVLERRRRLALRSATVALLVALVSFPLGMAIGGSESADTISGALLLVAIVGLVAAPWIVRAWQAFMQRRMVAAAVVDRPDIRHIDSELDRSAAQAALTSPAFALGTFRDSGLIEAFESATVEHVLLGKAQGVQFGMAQLALLDAKNYQMFSGVLASFRLERPRPSLTIVARDRGLLGNLLARLGGALERLPLEDPEFEAIFEVYGDDPVAGRVILTTTMMERLKALDELAHARGFACAFRGEHLLIAFNGMSWRCPAWRILQPIDAWLRSYVLWLNDLVDLPGEMVKTLALLSLSPGTLPPVSRPGRAVAPAPSVEIGSGTPEVFSSRLWRLGGEGGMALIYMASGAVFGGVALVGASYGLREGYSSGLFWYFWGMILAGLTYGAGAIGFGVWQLAHLAWKWNSPLRTLKRP